MAQRVVVSSLAPAHRRLTSKPGKRLGVTRRRAQYAKHRGWRSKQSELVVHRGVVIAYGTVKTSCAAVLNSFGEVASGQSYW